ncbi:hypothetical protein [Streptomyces sp. NPDC088847]|uniref:hypothetical protein n=1 Tax=Streptomyces sp. NPDC088847 TaxID=3365909 RepID=UPI003820685C
MTAGGAEGGRLLKKHGSARPQSAMRRLFRQRDQAGYGRPVDYDVGNHWYDGVLGRADIADLGYVNAIHVVRRGGEIIYSHNNDFGLPREATRARIAMERMRPWMPHESKLFEKYQMEIKNLSFKIGKEDEKKFIEHLRQRAIVERNVQLPTMRDISSGHSNRWRYSIASAARGEFSTVQQRATYSNHYSAAAEQVAHYAPRR